MYVDSKIDGVGRNDHLFYNVDNLFLGKKTNKQQKTKTK